MADELGNEKPEGFRPVPWNVYDMVFAIVVSVIGTFALFLVLGATNRGGEEETMSLPPWAGFTLQGILVGAVWFFGFYKYRVRPSSIWIMWGAPARTMFLLPIATIVLMIVVNAVYVNLAQATGIDILTPPPPEEQKELLGTGITRILNMAVIVIWGPFSEELFFRGFLLAGLIPIIGVLRGMIVSSLIFAAAHLLISTFIPIFFLGMLLSWLFVRTRSVWPPFVAHSIWNLLVTLVAIFLLD